jgi:ClpP class serine protease
MTDPLADLRRSDAHARWLSADLLALRPDAAAQITAGPVFFAGWMDDEEDDEEDPGYCVENGVAIVPIEGALMDRAGWWWDGYDEIQQRCEAAHADPNVRAVMLDMDSPGGMVAGLFDCMRALRAAKASSRKRMVAWVGSGAYSAAYGLASTCDEIVISDTAGVGSVGVIASLTSRVDQFAQDGIDVRVVSSGVEKTDGHPAIPISDAAVNRLNARVAELAGMFFSEVGIGRAALTADALRALDGGVRYGRASIAAGLADRIAGRSALLAELAMTPAPQTVNPAPQRGTNAAPFGRASRPNAMNEQQLAALAAAFGGETDPDKIVAAAAGLASRLAATEGSLAKMTEERAAAVSRADAAEKRATAMERDAEISAAKAAGQWTPALDGFLGSLNVEQLQRKTLRKKEK